LGELGEKSQAATEPLLLILEDLLQSETKDFQIDDFTQMDRVLRALGKIKDPKAVVPLLNILKLYPLNCACDHLRCSTILALGDLGDKQATEILIHVMLEDSWLRIRGEAALALGKIHDENAIEPLIKALENRGDGWPQRCAFEALLSYNGDLAAVPILRYLKQNPEMIAH
jgi:FOG: HEAT repeat